MTGELTITQFNEKVKAVLSSAGSLNDVSVIGEISEYKLASSGHVYITLKDASSALKCTLFRSAASKLTFKPSVGMKVVAFGSVSFYSPSGSLSFNILGMAPYGEGEQKKALEELTMKLFKEGLFDENIKRTIPRYPKTIGVVTSRTGAVIKDIIDTASRRFPANILLAPAQVQGEGADISIVNGIQLLDRYGVDVIIVGRGGGSADDLSAFNSEIVVRAVRACTVPVISAVGHATDKSLTDRAADKYAETPTMAATIATQELEGELRYISSLEGRLNRSLSSVIDRMKLRFSTPDMKLKPENALATIEKHNVSVNTKFSYITSFVANMLSKADVSFARVDSKLDPKRAIESISRYSDIVSNTSSKIDTSLKIKIERNISALDSLSDRLNSDSPYNVLGRGYSYVAGVDGKPLVSVASLSSGDGITIRMRDGSALAEVKEVTRNG